MPSTLTLKKTIHYSAPENHYLHEEISLEIDNEVPRIIFSVTINPQDDGLHCIVNHHSSQGVVFQRETDYPSLKGPFSPDNNDKGTLSAELVYLTHLYLNDEWLIADKFGHYRYPTKDSPRINQEIITMQKLESLSIDKQRFNSHETRYAILDCLRERNFNFDLKRQRIRKTENIYISPIEASTPRYVICANYAYQKGQSNNAASIAVLLHCLCLARSDFYGGFTRFTTPSLEIVLFDGTEGSEGAFQYLWNMREEERRKILGVINLELCGDGDYRISPPKERGDGKLLAAIHFASKQNKLMFQKEIDSPLQLIFERENIPFVTITTEIIPQTQPETISDEHLRKGVRILRDILNMFSFVKGDEITEIPDMSYVQDMPKVNLIKLDQERIK